MAGVERHLERWCDAGLVDEVLKQRILAFEGAGPHQQAAGPAKRPAVVEVLLYLGIAIALAGILALTADDWHALTGATRLAIVGIPGGLALVAGLFMRRAVEPPVARAGGIAWLAGGTLLGAAVAVAGFALGWSGPSTAAVSALCMAALAIALYAANTSRAQVIGIAGSLVFLSAALTARWTPDRPGLAGLLIALCGGVGIALAERRYLKPSGFAAGLFSLLVVAGALVVQFDLAGSWAGLPLLATGAGLVALSLRRGRFSYLMDGVLAIFAGLVSFIFRHFERTVGVPAALLMTGCLLVGGVLFVTAWHRRWQRRRGVRAAGIDAATFTTMDETAAGGSSATSHRR